MSTTDKLTDVLKKTSPDDLGDFLNVNWDSIIKDSKPFATYMRALLKAKGVRQQEMFICADIPEHYGYRLISEERHTRQRDVIIRLCIGGGFTLDETQKALRLAGFAPLYAKMPRDAALIIAINRSIGNVHLVNTLLAEHGMDQLAPCGQ